MKKIIKVSLVALLLLSLTACSAVFDSAISGTVKDKNVSSTSSQSTGGIADVMVYAYDNEEAWNNKYNSWDGKSEFEDHSVPSARTTQDGSFSISNLRWMTNSPAYGKDADSKTIYLLAFHKDYGLEKVEGRTIQSDKANNFGIIEMEKVTATKTLTISLKDIEDNTSTATGSDATITDTTGFSFKYTYADGYKTGSDGKFEDNVTGTISSFTNGKATITVKYNEKNFSTTDENNVTTYSVPSVTIYDIQTGSDWELETALENGKKVITYDTEKKEYKDTDLKFSNSWKTVTVNLSLIDGSSANLDTITDPIYFKWTYHNGEEVKNGNYTTSSGSYALSVKYKKDLETPTLVLSAFEEDTSDTEKKWIWTQDESHATAREDNSTLEIKLPGKDEDKDSITQKVYFRKRYITLPASGIGGYLISTSGNDAKKASGYGYTDDYGDVIKLKNEFDDVISNNNVTTRQQTVPTSSTSNIVNYGYFTGLASGKKVYFKYGTSYQSDDKTLTVEWTERGTSTTNSQAITINSMTTDFSNFMLYKN